MAQGQPLEAPSQAFARTSSNTQCRRAGGYDVNGKMTAASAIPMALEPPRPVGEMMHFVQQQNHRPTLRPCFGIRPATLPESG